MAARGPGIIIIFLGSGHGQLLGSVFLNNFRKTDIAKNVVLRGELASFPYGASAVHRSSVVSLNCFRNTRFLKTFLTRNDCLCTTTFPSFCLSRRLHFKN